MNQKVLMETLFCDNGTFFSYPAAISNCAACSVGLANVPKYAVQHKVGPEWADLLLC